MRRARPSFTNGMVRNAAAASFALVIASCSVLEPAPLPPEGQVVLGVATDAWLPRGSDAPYEPITRNALFERMRIELFAPGETEPCRECYRDFGAEHVVFNDGRATVGFVPRPGVSGYRARVRLYHAGATESSAEPQPSSTLEAVVSLPPVGPDGIVDVHVVLLTDDILTPRGTLASPVPASAGPPPKGLAGTWHADVSSACSSPAREGEACVPGGAFWFGDLSLSVPYERLVAVSPFFIDKHEATVADVRASGLASGGGTLDKGDPAIQGTDPTKFNLYCTYTTRPGKNEELPANCVSLELARRFCEARGGTLPSEAQFEFVAGARRDATFPWGDVNAGCEDAVFSRSYDGTKPPEWRKCAALGVGPAKPGSGRLDRVSLPDGEIVDLAGNLAEWTRDTNQDADEPCHHDNPVVDPVCTEPGRTAGWPIRGTSWAELGAGQLRAAASQSIGTSSPQGVRIGMRCVRPGR